MTKSLLRQTMRRTLGEFDCNQRIAASHALAARLTALDAWQKAAVVGLFAGRSDEMETTILWSDLHRGGKTFLYPKVAGDDLHFLVVESHSELQPSAWNLHEPTGAEPRVPDLVLVPGLAFEPNGGRLGRGKGFYDRWLAAHPAVVKVGVCFDFQIVPQIPMELHDRRMDFVVTEERSFP
jgi:5-formyltetrahydrofolate cyclo-ligase